MTEDADRNDVTDRVASRFDTDDDDDTNGIRDSRSRREIGDEPEKSVKNVKSEWTARTLYLPDDLESDASKTFKKLDLELDDEFETIRKMRHFYPLVLKEGLASIEGMESEELIEQLDEIDPDLDHFLADD